MLTRHEAIQLSQISDDTLSQLTQEAAAIRDQHFGNTLSYSPKVFIPLTNMCRDKCAYCTFAKTPESGLANLMSPDQVMMTVRKGEAQQCKEALFSLGEKPEARFSYAKQQLAKYGYDNMIDYLHDMAELVLHESSLIPHINAGTMTKAELSKLKHVSASMGMMLESTSTRLLKKGQAHHACPDKVPAKRLQTIADAGELRIPFTTGVLIGIGETWEERVDSILAINSLHLQYGHIQEVIVQNFRAKDDTLMAGFNEPTIEDMQKTIAVARLLLHPSISLQAPPNLEQHYAKYIDAGINDWGGISPVTKDFINPERAWPQIASLKKACHQKDFELKERLTVYKNYIDKPEDYLEDNIKNHIVKQHSSFQPVFNQPSWI
jgi:FO synthase